MENRPYRSLFWPVLLIGVGLVWLLGNLGIVPDVNINLLLSLWPIILIVIGLDILIGRRSALAGALIGLGAVAVVIAILVAAPAFGWSQTAEIQNKQFEGPVGNSTSAAVSLHLVEYSTDLYALNEADKLYDMDLDYYGTLNFSDTEIGNSGRRIDLDHEFFGSWTSRPFGANADWKIGLSPEIPLDLRINSGSGSGDLDLGKLKLTDFYLDSGSGSMDIILPSSTEGYNAEFISGSGSLNIDIPEQANLTMRLDTGSGSVNIDIPNNAAVRLEVNDDGSGAINLTNGLVKISGGDEDQGIWESSNYASAAMKILIVVDDFGSGSLNIR